MPLEPINLDWKPAVDSDGNLLYSEDQPPLNEPKPKSITKKLSAAFGSRRRRQAQLVARLKTRRHYAPPRRGGRKKGKF